MPNIASLLKSEIARVARKEIKAQTEALRKSAISQRSELSALRRRVSDLEAALKRLDRATHRDRPSAQSPAAAEAKLENLRFRASGMAANRKRLGLSAADFGLLVGVSGQSIYAWEAGKTKPGREHLQAIAALRGVSTREVMQRLEALRS